MNFFCNILVSLPLRNIKSLIYNMETIIRRLLQHGIVTIKNFEFQTWFLLKQSMVLHIHEKSKLTYEGFIRNKGKILLKWNVSKNVKNKGPDSGEKNGKPKNKLQYVDFITINRNFIQ